MPGICSHPKPMEGNVMVDNVNVVSPSTFDCGPGEADSTIEASCLVARLWAATRPLDDAEWAQVLARLTGLGVAFCPTCYAYQLATPRCWTPDRGRGAWRRPRSSSQRAGFLRPKAMRSPRWPGQRPS